MKKTYYFINAATDPETIFGSEMPCCISATEIARLAIEFEDPALIDKFHIATDDEIAEYGVYED